MRRALLLIAFLLPVSLHAQSTEADLKTRLLNKPFYLRGCWYEDTLEFDPAGALVGHSNRFPFTLSGIDIDSVTLTPDRLILTGTRAGLEVVDNTLRRISLSDVVHIEIHAPATHDYGSQLDLILASRLADMGPSLPEYWKYFDLPLDQTLPPPAKPDAPPAAHIGGEITAPHPIRMPNPSYNAVARAKKLSGNVLIYIQVDEHGSPTQIHLLRPLGLGLDEAALGAVGRYRFQPATQNGKPVTVEMNVEVNFKIR